MPKSKFKLKVIKVFKNESSTDEKKDFPFYGNMYLDLFENSKKVKEEFLFQDKSKQPILTLSHYEGIRKTISNPEKLHEAIPEENENEVNNKEDTIQKVVEVTPIVKEEIQEQKIDEIEKELAEKLQIETLDSKHKSSHVKTEIEQSLLHEDDTTIHEDDDNETKNDKFVFHEIVKEKSKEDFQDDNIGEKSEELNVEEHLKELLNKEDEKSKDNNIDDSENIQLEKSNVLSNEKEPRNENKIVISETERLNKLKKLKKPKVLSPDEILEKKRELLFKFKILKKSYPGSTIPQFTLEHDLKEIEQCYQDTIRMLSVDSSVEQYKSYLIGGFMITEFICGKFLNFDMEGFAQQQILQINKYNKLLIELGEKSYVPSGKQWPVEVRILFMILMNAATFIISKLIMKNTGTNLLNMINAMNLGSTSTTSNNMESEEQMKGPDINLDDL